MYIDDSSPFSSLLVEPSDGAAGKTLVWKWAMFQLNNDKLRLVSSQEQSFVLVHVKSDQENYDDDCFGKLMAA